MAFFIGIAGPWILLMVLGLLATNRTLEVAPATVRQGWTGRLGHLLRERDVAPRARRVLRPTTIETAAPATLAPTETITLAQEGIAADPATADPELGSTEAPAAKRSRRARGYETQNGQPS